MIALLGATGYVGSAFRAELERRELTYKPILHKGWRAMFDTLHPYSLVINCAAFIPHRSVSDCDENQGETIRGNVLLPAMLAEWCAVSGIPLAHISTGCLWDDGLEHGENEPPQRAFKGYCGFYVGTKVMSEEAVRDRCSKHFIWRIRLPFDEYDCPRNYLTKLATFPEVFDHENSVSHLGDFAKGCLDLWQGTAEYGTYHVMNKGAVKATDIIERMIELGIRKDRPKIIQNRAGACKVSIAKLEAAGVKMRSAHDAVEDSLRNWKSFNPNPPCTSNGTNAAPAIT